MPDECAGSLEDVGALEDGSLGEPAPAGNVVAVEVRGASIPEALVRRAIRLETGAPLSEDAIRADVRSLLALQVFEDVRVHVDAVDSVEAGVRVTYELVERPRIASARLVGEGGPARHRVEGLRGEVFQPGRLQRLAGKITSDRRREGFAEATARVAAREAEAGVAVCVVVDAGRRWVVDALELEGNAAIDDDALRASMTTLDGRVNVEGGVYREDLLEEDAQRMLALYFDAGHVTAHIGAPVVRGEGDALRVTIPITEGPVYTLRELRVSGDLAGPASAYLDFLGLQTGVRSDRGVIARAIDRLRAREQGRGRFDVSPTATLDEEGPFVDLEIRVQDLDEPESPERADARPEREGPRLMDGALRGPDASLAPPGTR